MVPRGVDPGQPAGEGLAHRHGAVAPGADMQRTDQLAGEHNGSLSPALPAEVVPVALPGAAPAAVPVVRNTAAVAAVASTDNLFLMVGSRGRVMSIHIVETN